MSPSNAGGEGEKGKERDGEREKDVAYKKIPPTIIAKWIDSFQKLHVRLKTIKIKCLFPLL